MKKDKMKFKLQVVEKILPEDARVQKGDIFEVPLDQRSSGIIQVIDTRCTRRKSFRN